MIILKALVLALARHTQTSGDSAFADGENCADQQGLSIIPDGLGKKRLKIYDQWQQFGMQSLGWVRVPRDRKKTGGDSRKAVMSRR